jgi:hypothetical protein
MIGKFFSGWDWMGLAVKKNLLKRKNYFRKK